MSASSLVGILIGDVGPGDLEAGAVLRAAGAVRRASRTRGSCISSCMTAIVAVPRRPRGAGAAGAADARSPWSPAGRRSTIRAPCRRRQRPQPAMRRHAMTITHPVAIDLPARSGGIDQSVLAREQGAGRGDQPPQRAARRAQPRRADDADRLRRHRNRPGADACCARCRAGTTACRRFIFRPNHLAPTFREVAGGEAAALQRLLRHRGRQAGRRRELEARARRPDRRQAAVDARSRSTRCPSRR